LKVFSKDSAFLCYYALDESCTMQAVGSPLGAEPDDATGEREYTCPRWENDDWSITPGGVSAFIRWCLAKDTILVST